jgi:hypothetical protein
MPAGHLRSAARAAEVLLAMHDYPVALAPSASAGGK